MNPVSAFQFPPEQLHCLKRPSSRDIPERIAETPEAGSAHALPASHPTFPIQR